MDGENHENELRRAYEAVFGRDLPPAIQEGDNVKAYQGVRLSTAEVEDNSIAIMIQLESGEVVAYVMSLDRAEEYGRQYMEFVAMCSDEKP